MKLIITILACVLAFNIGWDIKRALERQGEDRELASIAYVAGYHDATEYARAAIIRAFAAHSVHEDPPTNPKPDL